MALPEGEAGGWKAVGVPLRGKLWGNGVHLGLLGTLSSLKDGLPVSIGNEQRQKAHLGSKGAQLPLPSPGSTLGWPGRSTKPPTRFLVGPQEDFKLMAWFGP